MRTWKLIAWETYRSGRGVVTVANVLVAFSSCCVWSAAWMGTSQKCWMLRSSVDGFKGLLYLLNQTFTCSSPSLESPQSTKATVALGKQDFTLYFKKTIIFFICSQPQNLLLCLCAILTKHKGFQRCSSQLRASSALWDVLLARTWLTSAGHRNQRSKSSTHRLRMCPTGLNLCVSITCIAVITLVLQQLIGLSQR